MFHVSRHRLAYRMLYPVECRLRTLCIRTIEAQYAFRRHAITLFPVRERFTIRLLCVRHYDVPSVGWTFSSGCSIFDAAARDQIRPFTGCLAPAEACRCNICTRRPPSLKALAFKAFYSGTRYRTFQTVAARYIFTVFVRHAARAVLILRNSSRPNLLTSFFCTPSLILSLVPPTLTIPLVGRGYAPLIVLSSLARKRSRLYAQTETFIGVVSVTSRYFLELMARFTGRRRTNWPDIPNHDRFLNRNSKLGPVEIRN